MNQPLLFFYVSSSPSMASTASAPPGYQNQIIAHSDHGFGSTGPFFAVMSVLIILAVLSCIFGSLFASGMVDGPDSSYDCLGCVRRSYQRSRCGVTNFLTAAVKKSVSTQSRPES
ncbi:hypothetical protein HPP92_008134 [Vanilla planifolia]|uniref:Uncharacterized protein n=1 Tax=Vanilla planifolia TaxID=51239 RepID=A0A835V3H6_VANPL|nr:hypothetical protein HPP92_008295 [Vanilla planifolia]KAG0486039.1 hypothetical protein HPP92_008134 [Vanilla planifolia]